MSEAEKDVIATVSEVDVGGTVKAVIVGAIVSAAGGSVIVVDALIEFEILPAASLAQAYSVLVPALPNVWLDGDEDDHPAVLAVGLVDDSVSR